MKKVLTICAVVVTMTSIVTASTMNYGNVNFTGANWQNGNWSDIWDLTQGDITLSYTMNMTGLQAQPVKHNIQFGLRQSGHGNIDPASGAHLTSNCRDLTDEISINDNDHHTIQASGTWADDELDYNVDSSGNVVSAFGTYNTFGFNFDRGEVDQYQAQQWDMKNGATYNTGGIYDIELVFHAINATSGTVYASINDYSQGIYDSTPDFSLAPDYYPAGRSISGDLTTLQVFYGSGSFLSGETAQVTDLTITQVPEPATLCLLGLGGLLLRRRKNA